MEPRQVAAERTRPQRGPRAELVRKQDVPRHQDDEDARGDLRIELKWKIGERQSQYRDEREPEREVAPACVVEKKAEDDDAE
jgi:hypothetical protein